MARSALDRYLGSRAVSGPWRLEGSARCDFAAAVVIPSLAEGDSLWTTLEALSAQPAASLQRSLVVVVVNHRADAPQEYRVINREDLARLRAGDLPAGLEVAWVDAASPGRELPPGEGVGLARKIGFDLALSRLDHSGSRGALLLSLDADTWVDREYLPAVFAHFSIAREGGAVLPFIHRPGRNASEEEAIGRYELYLRATVLGLELAGSPYAYHTIGSALACRAEAYAAAGGMNRRCAGEDFYFLQQLAKTCGVARLRGTVVQPSPRPSRRTPFGTGRTVARLLAGEEAVRFYHPRAFRLLEAWLQSVQAAPAARGEELLARAAGFSAEAADFLQEVKFCEIWRRLCRNHASPEARIRGFHGWFDGLRTRRFLHRLCSGPLSCGAAAEMVPPLLEWAGLSPPVREAEMLESLRRAQAGAG